MIPINVDRNVSIRDYDDDFRRGVLRVTSWFYTYQGEGPFAGHPAIFLRLAGCNIGAKEDCPFCDTAFRFADGMSFDVSDIIALLKRHQTKLVVITGGEPLLQWQTLVKVFAAVAEHPAGRGVQWQIETNGMLLRQEMFDACKAHNVYVVVSPKIPHNKAGYPPIHTTRLWNTSQAPMAFKYVVEATPASKYYNVPVEALQLHVLGVPIYVSGMTVYKRAPKPGEVASIWNEDLIDRAATARNYRHAAQLALKLNLRVSFQSHLFGDVE
jgi:organic radical activating enzyme